MLAPGQERRTEPWRWPTTRPCADPTHVLLWQDAGLCLGDRDPADPACTPVVIIVELNARTLHSEALARWLATARRTQLPVRVGVTEMVDVPSTLFAGISDLQVRYLLSQTEKFEGLWQVLHEFPQVPGQHAAP